MLINALFSNQISDGLHRAALEEAVLDEKGKVEPGKLNSILFDQFRNGYYAIGEQVGKAWNAGAALMKK